jgi:serine/threonine-protein kinase
MTLRAWDDRRSEFATRNLVPLLELASGGMGTLHVAKYAGALGFERLVAVKRTHPHLRTDPKFCQMLREEARIGALIRHPNVVTTIGLVESEGDLLLVQEYVDAVTSGTLLAACSRAGERLAFRVAVRIVADVLSGLHAAHETLDLRGRPLEIVHRDVSPQNILVGADGVTRVIDFGVAKALGSLSEQTLPGVTKGKWAYMAPEQIMAARVDRRADVFAAGIVLHEALTGQRLFRARDESEAIRLVCEEPIPTPSSRCPDVPPALDAIVMCALDRDRERRFATAALFLEELECACRPAPWREVAALVQRRCGERLADRRASLALVTGPASSQ